MGKYRKKTVVIEAFKWTGDINQEEDPEWIIEAIKNEDVRIYEISALGETSKIYMKIDTLEGTHTANVGDYIIKGIKGEIYPCKADIFEATYEVVENKALSFADAENEDKSFFVDTTSSFNYFKW